LAITSRLCPTYSMSISISHSPISTISHSPHLTNSSQFSPSQRVLKSNVYVDSPTIGESTHIVLSSELPKTHIFSLSYVLSYSVKPVDVLISFVFAPSSLFINRCNCRGLPNSPKRKFSLILLLSCFHYLDVQSSLFE
jgi:hypothetical protein